MFSRRCPFCKEKIKKGATVCRYCNRELGPHDPEGSHLSLGLLAGFLGVAAGAACAVLYGYYRERLRWKEVSSDYVPEEDREEEF